MTSTAAKKGAFGVSKNVVLPLLALAILLSCARQATDDPESGVSLDESRQGFATTLIRRESIGEPAPIPPSHLFTLVHYPSPVGDLAAYLSVPPQQGGRHPAIVWVLGGLDNSIGDTAWEPGPPENDQSVGAFREAGIVTMYPSFRGGNDNPGYIEGFYGEVDDVLAAAEFLARQDFVDPRRIYLGGHSTGGTMALLAAESSDRFRAVFSFGPVAYATDYGQENLPFKISNRKERKLRAPLEWLSAIHTPTYVFEGTVMSSNIDALEELSQVSNNPEVHFYPVEGGDHFSILLPLTRLIATKIRADQSPTVNILFTEREIDRAVSYF